MVFERPEALPCVVTDWITAPTCHPPEIPYATPSAESSYQSTALSSFSLGKFSPERNTARPFAESWGWMAIMDVDDRMTVWRTRSGVERVPKVLDFGRGGKNVEKSVYSDGYGGLCDSPTNSTRVSKLQKIVERQQRGYLVLVLEQYTVHDSKGMELNSPAKSGAWYPYGYTSIDRGSPTIDARPVPVRGDLQPTLRIRSERFILEPNQPVTNDFPCCPRPRRADAPAEGNLQKHCRSWIAVKACCIESKGWGTCRAAWATDREGRKARNVGMARTVAYIGKYARGTFPDVIAPVLKRTCCNLQQSDKPETGDKCRPQPGGKFKHNAFDVLRQFRLHLRVTVFCVNMQGGHGVSDATALIRNAFTAKLQVCNEHGPYRALAKAARHTDVHCGAMAEGCLKVESVPSIEYECLNTAPLTKTESERVSIGIQAEVKNVQRPPPARHPFIGNRPEFRDEYNFGKTDVDDDFKTSTILPTRHVSERRRNIAGPDRTRSNQVCPEGNSNEKDKKCLRSASATGYGNKVKTMNWEAELEYRIRKEITEPGGNARDPLSVTIAVYDHVNPGVILKMSIAPAERVRLRSQFLAFGLRTLKEENQSVPVNRAIWLGSPLTLRNE
ncbi:hypothetical protein DFH09DRAFT_1101569 [Mycena vulgaris]|nr:hypothetical protein DFH09DRAFT_1101569 [Mycena vulgaris]